MERQVNGRTFENEYNPFTCPKPTTKHTGKISTKH